MERDRDNGPVERARAQQRRPGVGAGRRGEGFRGASGGGGGVAALEDTHVIVTETGTPLATETGALISDGS
jgi:hypothetical protein